MLDILLILTQTLDFFNRLVNKTTRKFGAQILLEIHVQKDIQLKKLFEKYFLKVMFNDRYKLQYDQYLVFTLCNKQ